VSTGLHVAAPELEWTLLSGHIYRSSRPPLLTITIQARRTSLVQLASERAEEWAGSRWARIEVRAALVADGFLPSADRAAPAPAYTRPQGAMGVRVRWAVRTEAAAPRRSLPS